MDDKGFIIILKDGSSVVLKATRYYNKTDGTYVFMEESLEEEVAFFKNDLVVAVIKVSLTELKRGNAE